MFIIEIIEGISEKTSRYIDYKFFDNNSSSLLIILPGVDYSAKAPILYYLNKQYLNMGYSILQINYEYSNNTLSLLSEEEFFEDIYGVLEVVLKNREFNNIDAVAKSIGTIGLAKLSEVTDFNKKMWLTPMLNNITVQNAISKNSEQSYIFIGNQDPFYSEEKLKEFELKGSIITTYKNADHSLEISGEINETLDILKDLLFKISRK